MEVSATVGRNALGTQIVIFGQMFFALYVTTIVKPAQPENLSKKRKQNDMTPWEVSGGMSIIEFNDTERGIIMVKLI